MNTKMVIVAAAIVSSAAACGEIIWREKVDGAEAAGLLEKVKSGDALVVAPVVSADQVAGLTNAFPDAVSFKLAKDPWGYPVLNVGGKSWSGSSYPISDRGNCLLLRRHGKGLVVVSHEDGRGRARFEANLRRELAFQNIGLVYRGCSCECWDSGSRGPEPMRGRGCVDLSLENATGTNVEVSVELRLEDAEGRVHVYNGSGAASKPGRFSVRASGQFLGYGEVKATLTATEKSSGTRIVANEWKLTWPKYFSLRMPEYRGLVSAARRTAAVRLAATFGNYHREDPFGRPLDVAVFGPGGKEVAKLALRFASAPMLEFDVPLARDAAPGTYRVRAETTAGDGAPVVAEDTFKIVPVRPGQGFIDQDGALLADGKPWFPFGIYHLSKGDFDAVAALGIDLIQAWPNAITDDSLRLLEAKGIRVAFETAAWPQVVNNWGAWRGSVPECIEFEADADFRARAELVKSHPKALAFWYTADEAGYGHLPGVNRIRDYWRRFDPEDHPTYIVTTGDARMGEAGEVLGYDNYPRSFGAKRPMTDVADGLDSIYRASPLGRCVVMVPQSFGVTNRHKESPEELKCMAYLSMVHGAKGVFWYCWWDGGNQGACYDANTRRAIKETIDEAKEFKLALLAPGFVRMQSEDGRVHACLCGDETTGRYLVAVNGADDPSDGVVRSFALKGLALEPLFGSPAVKPTADGRLAVPLKGAERAVWRVR